MKRIKGFAASVLLALLVVCPGTAAADTLPLGDTGYFVAGVKSEEFVHFAAPESAGKQRMENWCWAACIQMVLNYHGLYVDQQDIVTRIYGAAIDRPANGESLTEKTIARVGGSTGWASSPPNSTVPPTNSTYLIPAPSRMSCTRWVPRSGNSTPSCSPAQQCLLR